MERGAPTGVTAFFRSRESGDGGARDRRPPLREWPRGLWAMVGVLSAAAAVLTSAIQWVPGTGAPHTPSAAAAGIREIELTAQETDWELFPGTKVKAWTYNGTLPGPELRVTEGDLVRVTLRNALPVPTALHFHGIDLPNAMDGVPGLTQDAVPPGGSFVYEFIATNPGTRWYHSHQDAEVQGPLGLYGPMIVEPKAPEPVQYDREYTYVLSEWALALTPAVALGEASLPTSGPGAPHAKQLDFDLFLMNGKAHDSIPPLQLKQGERVRIRLTNAGQLVHTIHSHGHSFKIVATDGNLVPAAAQLTKDSVTLGPSERVDLELRAVNPGIWMFHCHMEHHMANGMMTTIRYEGVQPPVLPAAGPAGGRVLHAPPPAGAGQTAAVVSGHQHGAPVTPAVATTPVATTPVATTPVAAPAPATGAAPAATEGGARIVMVDNRVQHGRLTVAKGTTVTWVNNGSNVHTISAQDGSFDSGAVAPGQSFAYTFDTSGEVAFFCRQHLLNGMGGTVGVQ
jgi:plastocyanin